jgi:hypothetical protein
MSKIQKLRAARRPKSRDIRLASDFNKSFVVILIPVHRGHFARCRPSQFDYPRRADRIAITACRERSRQELIKVTPDPGNLFFVEDANSGQIPVAIEGCDLVTCERCRMLCRGWMEA